MYTANYKALLWENFLFSSKEGKALAKIAGLFKKWTCALQFVMTEPLIV